MREACAVRKDAGDYLGLLMSGGEIMVLGKAGTRAGWRMKGGSIEAKRLVRRRRIDALTGTGLASGRGRWRTGTIRSFPCPARVGLRDASEFPFQNYSITIDQDSIRQGPLYLENLFDHLIVHYLFCPRSLETAGRLALAAMKGLKDQTQARSMVNIFSDIVVDSFRLERSAFDEKKVILGWTRLALQRRSFAARSGDFGLPGRVLGRGSASLPAAGGRTAAAGLLIGGEG